MELPNSSYGRKRKAKSDAIIPRDSEFYDMNNPRRGIAVIFNQNTFLDPSFNRVGSLIDLKRVESTFKRLGFEVTVFNDLRVESIKNMISNLSKRNFSDCDCFVLVFMSHGTLGKLLAYDELFDINLLWDPFTGDVCPSLVNKPKLFFIQACQGPKSQGSVTVEVSGGKDTPTEAEESNKFIPSYKIPNRADFLVALATIPGYLSWRSPTNGTYFIQSLCDKLDKDGFNLDIQTLLTRVIHKVAIDFKNCSFTSQTGTCSKQLPTMISMLIRTLSFTDKKKKDCQDETETKAKRSKKN